jgi:hypothetical protein
MSASVRISLKAARELLKVAHLNDPFRPESSRAQDELSAAIDRATRASATRRKLRQPKEEKRAAKRAATSAVREAVLERAQGTCECGCGEPFTFGISGLATMDHFEGKARSESLETCWALRWACHNRKTNNYPDAAFWLESFIAHCDKHAYPEAADRARTRLGYVLARSAQ